MYSTSHISKSHPSKMTLWVTNTYASFPNSLCGRQKSCIEESAFPNKAPSDHHNIQLTLKQSYMPPHKPLTKPFRSQTKDYNNNLNRYTSHKSQSLIAIRANNDALCYISVDFTDSYLILRRVDQTLQKRTKS